MPVVVGEAFSSELTLVLEELTPTIESCDSNADSYQYYLLPTSLSLFCCPAHPPRSAQHTFTCRTEERGGASHFTRRSTPACRLISVGHLLLDTHKRPSLVVAGSHPASFENLTAPSKKVSLLLLSKGKPSGLQHRVIKGNSYCPLHCPVAYRHGD